MNIEQIKSVIAEIVTRTDPTPCVAGHRGSRKSELNQAQQEDVEIIIYKR